MSDCIFCKIIKKEIPCYKIYENDDIISFLDINPVSPGHILVTPKKHYNAILDLPEDLLCKIVKSINKITKVVLQVIECEAFNLVVNTGKNAGQLIDHVHFHIIPRLNGDKRKLCLSPIKYKKGEIEELKKKIINKLK